ncbi:MAG: DNA modification methylase [Bdellovibrio sp.]
MEISIHCKYDELLDPKKLKNHPKNRNKHSQEQIDRLAKLYTYHGVRHPIIVSKLSGFIVAGHGRKAAGVKAGIKQMPVVYQEFANDEAEYAFIQADNAIASWAELDLSGINEDLADLGPDFDLDFLGIKNFTIDVADKELGDEEDTPEPPKEPKVVRGEVYILGDHRLMCGDSTSIDDVEKLMAGKKADMVFTDPPYGVDYQGGAFTKRNKLDNDHKSTNIYADVIPLIYAFTKDKAGIYIWHAAGYADMASHIGENDLEIRSQIIWNKNIAQFGALSAQYKQKHEPCFYCFKKGCAPNWYGPTNEVAVWDVKRESKNEFHPTQKPVELGERALNNSSKEKDIVLDLFGGSGSTLIAAEKTNRHARLMELDPIYCAVILDRWEKYTNKKAIREDGTLWEAIKNG